MNPLLATAAIGLIRAGIEEFLAWREKKAQEVGWVPSASDVDAFLADIDAATPEAVKEQARKDLGLPEIP